MASSHSPGPRRNRRLVVAAIVGICVLIFGAVVIADVARPAVSPPTHPETWDPVLAPYVVFIEFERGLSFDHPVNVRWAEIAEEIAEDLAADEVSADWPDDEALVDPWAEAYRVLGLSLIHI